MAQKWDKIWFVDEKKFDLDGPDSVKFYFHDLRKESMMTSRRQNGGGNIMVWVGVSSRGITELALKMKSSEYQTIVENFLLPKFQNGDELVQDNAPIHASMSTRDWLKSNNVPLIQWPSNSPDLNSIENQWGHISRQLYENGTQFHSVRELKIKTSV